MNQDGAIRRTMNNQRTTDAHDRAQPPTITRDGEHWHGTCPKCWKGADFIADYYRQTLTCTRLPCGEEFRLVHCGCGLRTAPWRRLRALESIRSRKAYEKPLVCPDCGMTTTPAPLPRPAAHRTLAGCQDLSVVLGGLLGTDGDADLTVLDAAPDPRHLRTKSKVDYRRGQYRALMANTGASGAVVNDRGELEVRDQ